MCSAAYTSQRAHVPSISLSFLCYGGISSLFTRLLPRLYDSQYCGPRGLLLLLTLLLPGAYAIYIMSQEEKWDVWAYMITCAMLGAADATMACLVRPLSFSSALEYLSYSLSIKQSNMAIVISYRKSESTQAFTAYRMWCALSTSCGLLVAELTSTRALQVVVISFLVIALIGHVLLNWYLHHHHAASQSGVLMEHTPLIPGADRSPKLAPTNGGPGLIGSSDHHYTPPKMASNHGTTLGGITTIALPPPVIAGTHGVSNGGSIVRTNDNGSVTDRNLARSASRSVSAPSVAAPLLASPIIVPLPVTDGTSIVPVTASTPPTPTTTPAVV
jgi:hypothetical protein